MLCVSAEVGTVAEVAGVKKVEKFGRRVGSFVFLKAQKAI